MTRLANQTNARRKRGKRGQAMKKIIIGREYRKCRSTKREEPRCSGCGGPVESGLFCDPCLAPCRVA